MKEGRERESCRFEASLKVLVNCEAHYNVTKLASLQIPSPMPPLQPTSNVITTIFFWCFSSLHFRVDGRLAFGSVMDCRTIKKGAIIGAPSTPKLAPLLLHISLATNRIRLIEFLRFQHKKKAVLEKKKKQ